MASPISTQSVSGSIQPTQDVKMEASSLDVNREILKEVAKIYNPPEVQTLSSSGTTKKRLLRRRSSEGMAESAPAVGLRRIGQLVNQPVSMSHHKAAVMVIGNISAGKSTFINWYVQEAVQKTGMAIETSGFTYITSGRCVTEIGGESTLALRPQLQKLTSKYKGFLENLSLKTCPSRDGRLHLVDLIDTPGLADGELQYPFDVEEIIFDMKQYVDLFFVFFDPIGQALGRRMLSIVKRLNDTCPDKMRFCLTKVDEVRTEEERIKVMCQTTQSLTAKISSRHGFDLVPIYIPGAKNGTYLSLSEDAEESRNSHVVNRLKDLVEDVDRVTERRVQDSLNTLLADVDRLTAAVNKRVEEHAAIKRSISIQKSRARRYTVWRLLVLLFSVILGIVHLKTVPRLAPNLVSSVDDWISFVDPSAVHYVNLLVKSLAAIPYLFLTLWSIVGLLFLVTVSFRSTPVISQSDQEGYSRFLECHEFLHMARIRWKQLNRLYLDHAMNDSGESSSLEL